MISASLPFKTSFISLVSETQDGGQVLPYNQIFYAYQSHLSQRSDMEHTLAYHWLTLSSSVGLAASVKYAIFPKRNKTQMYFMMLRLLHPKGETLLRYLFILDA